MSDVNPAQLVPYVTGGAFAGNTLAGIIGSAGVLTIQGGAVLNNNTTHGLHVGAATTTVTSADIHHNTLDGVFVSAGGGGTSTIGSPGASPAAVT